MSSVQALFAPGVVRDRDDDAGMTSADGRVDRAPELAVVIPTLNERDNVPLVVERLNRVLAGIDWEAIFVDDDSPDGTADVVRALARRQSNIRCVQRLGRRGLASACIEGILPAPRPMSRSWTAICSTTRRCCR